MPSTTTRLLAAMAATAMLAGACSSDDDSDANVAAGVQEYCDLMALLDSQDGPPTVEQLTTAKEIRPDSVGADLDVVADAFIEAGDDIGAAFADPAVGEALERVEAHDVEACGFDEPDGEGNQDDDVQVAEPAEGAQVFEITGVNFAFENVPSEVPAGLTALGFTNEGDAAHEMAVFGLPEGTDVDQLLADFFAALESEEASEEDQQAEVGFTFASPGDGPFYVNADLEPGTYLLACFIPGPEGKAHYELGMRATFTVV